MTRRRLALKVHPSFIGYAVVLSLIDGPASVCGFLVALVAHEAAHLLAGAMLCEPLERVELTPFGGIITYQAGRSACKGVKGVVLASAGPIGNYASMALLSRLPAQQGVLLDAQRAAIIVNLSMMLVNLLPVLPLDGGRIVFSIGYYFFPVALLVSALGALGVIMGSLFILLGGYGFFAVGTLNITLLIVGVYIVFCAQKDRQSLLANELYTVLYERMNRKKDASPVRVYAVSDDADLSSVIPLLCRPGKYVCVIRQGDGGHIACEEELIHALFAAPHQPISSLFDRRD